MGSFEMAPAGRGWAPPAPGEPRGRRRRAERGARSGDVEVVEEMVRQSVRRARERAKSQPRAAHRSAAAAANAPSSSGTTSASTDSDETRIRRQDRFHRRDRGDARGRSATRRRRERHRRRRRRSMLREGNREGNRLGSRSSFGSVAELDAAPILRCASRLRRDGRGRSVRGTPRTRTRSATRGGRSNAPNAAPDDALRARQRRTRRLRGHFAAQERLARRSRDSTRGATRKTEVETTMTPQMMMSPLPLPMMLFPLPPFPSPPRRRTRSARFVSGDVGSSLPRVPAIRRAPGDARRDAAAAAALRLRDYDATAVDAAAATALEAHIDALAGATRDAAADGLAPERLVPSLGRTVQSFRRGYRPAFGGVRRRGWRARGRRVAPTSTETRGER